MIPQSLDDTSVDKIAPISTAIVQDSEAALFFFRYESCDNDEGSCLYRENTVYLYDSPLWDDPSAIELVEERLTISGLRSKLQSIAGQTVTSLHISCEAGDTWKFLHDENEDDTPPCTATTWKQFCQLIQEYLPHVTTLDVEQPHNLCDKQWILLFQQPLLSTQLSKLTMNGIGGDLPGMFRQIGISLKQLEELVLTGDGDSQREDENISDSDSDDEEDIEFHQLSTINGENLGHSLQHLPRLRKVAISNFVTQNPMEFWPPVLRAIRNNSKLEKVQFQGGYYREDKNDTTTTTAIAAESSSVQPLKEFRLGKKTVAALQFGPRLNHAKQKYLDANEADKDNSNERQLERWVDALASAQDRIDCVHFLLSQMDPNLYCITLLS